MINDKKENNNSPDGKAKLLMLFAIVIALGLFLWTAYSFWGFWQDWQKPPQDVEADSYIDKAGLDEVKSILERRK